MTSNDIVHTGGRAPALDEHLNGLWYVLRSGVSWRALPDLFGKWGAIHQYFNRLTHAGFFDWLHERLVLESDAEVVFAASIYFRGIPYIQIPTTVVSLVDSSVGGKTGINTPEGKNLIGTFHQPRLVIADPQTLRTLPDREFNEGFAEIIKHAAIRDAEMLPMIDAALARGGREGLTELIARNVGIKAAIVSEDQFETKGLRALLNFGHTIGHAIEACAGYGELLHGEAISLGLRAACWLSEEFAGLPASATERLCSLLSGYRLPVRLTDSITTPRILEKMGRDKKFDRGAIRFVLCRSIGDAFVSSDVTQDAIIRVVERLREE